MAKGGLLKNLGLGLGGAALLGTGLGAAGVGPLAGLFGAGETAGAGAGLGALGEAGTAATTAGELGSGLSAGELLAAPATAGEVVSSASTPLAAGSSALSAAGDVTGLGATVGSGLSTAAQLAGAANSTSDILGVEGGLSVPSDLTSSNLLTNTLEGGEAIQTGAPSTNLANFAGTGQPADVVSAVSGDPNLSLAAYDAAGGGTRDWLDKAGDWFSRNQGWLKPAVAGGGLAMSIGRDTGTIPGSGPVTQAAKDATTEGAFLTGQANQNLGALNTGALPAGAQSAIDNASRAAKSTVRSQYAAMGMHAPPAALAAVDQQSAALKLAEAEKLVTLGAKESALATSQQDLASYDYNALMKAEIAQNKDLADSIARFAAALA